MWVYDCIISGTIANVLYQLVAHRIQIDGELVSQCLNAYAGEYGGIGQVGRGRRLHHSNNL